MWTQKFSEVRFGSEALLNENTSLSPIPPLTSELGLCCTRGIDRAGASLPALLPEALREEARRGAAEGERADGLPAVGAARLEARDGGGGEHLVSRVKGFGSGSGLP